MQQMYSVGKIGMVGWDLDEAKEEAMSQHSYQFPLDLTNDPFDAYELVMSSFCFNG
jgi:hypothetical protein